MGKTDEEAVEKIQVAEGFSIYVGDVREALKDIPDESVNMCVTSPPYWNLRDYSTATWEGGNPDCNHIKGEMRRGLGLSDSSASTRGGAKKIAETPNISYGNNCEKCGAERVDKQLGLENSPEEYVQNMVEIFREVRRILRGDGTLWLNLGSSYAASRSYQVRDNKHIDVGNEMSASIPQGFKPKDLIPIPWMVAMALQQDGWYLRSDIIWAKPNPLPESVRDRPTKAHEYLFLLSKNPQYYYNNEAIREPAEWSRWGDQTNGKHEGMDSAASWIKPKTKAELTPARRKPLIPEQTKQGVGSQGVGSETFGHWADERGRNKRTVWHIATQPYSKAHFACVDEATECLTASGWKNHNHINPGELAAQYDIEEQVISWGAIETIARYEVVDQEMVVGRCRDLDIYLTPNHRCVIQRRHPQTRKALPPVIVRADALKNSHLVPTTADWAYEGDTSLPLEWAELLGWYIAEGHESKRTLAVELYQSESANPEKVARIEELLRQVGAEWTSSRSIREWRGRPSVSVAFRVTGYAAVRLRELAPSKQIPSDSPLWSKNRIEAFMAGILGGDGSLRPDGRLSFIQKDERQAGMVQALAIRLGLSATLSKRSDGICTVYLTKHKTRSFRGTNGVGVSLGRELYTGIVWCPKLPNGTWVARRNGRVFITGNTFPEKLVEPCILAGCPEFICATCGNPRERILTLTHDMSSPKSESDFFGDGRDPGVHRKLGAAYQKKLDAAERLSDWSDCGHENYVPGVVLDPFLGSGTTAQVARSLGRHCIGVELNPDYVDLAIEHYHTMTKEEKLRSSGPVPEQVKGQLSFEVEA